mgnify:CR=1 FL=1|jgi:hypothetical protein
MRARSWNQDLDRDCVRLKVRSIWRDMVGWGGVFLAILVLLGLAILLGPNKLSPRAFYALAALVTAPFAGVFLVGAWGDAWLTRIRRRGRGVEADPVWRRRLFLALVVTWVRTASAFAVVWLLGGLVVVALFAH